MKKKEYTFNQVCSDSLILRDFGALRGGDAGVPVYLLAHSFHCL